MGHNLKVLDELGPSIEMARRHHPKNLHCYEQLVAMPHIFEHAVLNKKAIYCELDLPHLRSNPWQQGGSDIKHACDKRCIRFFNEPPKKRNLELAPPRFVTALDQIINRI